VNGYLLDTHVVLWWFSDPDQLSPPAREAISDGSNLVYVSSAAAWEMAIKKAIGRLDMPGNLEVVLAAERIRILPITLPHALAVADLPLLHTDPFDRMQIVQAQHEGLTLITRDKQIPTYEVPCLLA
jgi:PIN domain nuclease of toxin-antitoxin system